MIDIVVSLRANWDLLCECLLIPTTEELLIDFYELIGEHSGENMVAVVWSMLELYGIQNKVWCPYVHCLTWGLKSSRWSLSWWTMPATTTMVDAIEARCFDAGIKFSAMQSRMCCMPHTIHLACIKVHSNSTLFVNHSSPKLNPSSFSKILAWYQKIPVNRPALWALTTRGFQHWNAGPGVG